MLPNMDDIQDFPLLDEVEDYLGDEEAHEDAF